MTCIQACSKTSTSPQGPSNIDFTLDLTQSSNVALKNDGGMVYSQGVLVAKTKSGTYIAVAATCTHQGSTVQYRLSSDDIYCASHGSVFSDTGSVKQGPASTALKQYATTLTGNSLRVQG
jgi:cytochrome b6-f complex iron-sulfur subunit